MVRVTTMTDTKLTVVSPVPYFPPINCNWRFAYSQVSRHAVLDGIDVHYSRYLVTPKLGMSLYGLWMFLATLPTVMRIQRTFDFDVIDAHYVYPDGFAAMLLGRWFKKPVIVSARGSDINQFKDLPMIRTLLKRTLLNVDKVIAVSHALKDSMVRLGIPPERVCVIPNGIDPGKFAPLPREEARKSLKIGRCRLILSVGNLTENKGMDLLIKALHLLVCQRQRDDLRLAIVGDGPCRPALERLITSIGFTDRVMLVGSVPHHDLRQWYSAADVFCLASEREGLPNVILESLACGTPVVATPAGGIPEVIYSERVGLLTRRDEGHLADAIAMALERNWDRHALAQGVHGWTWDHVAAKLQDVFESVASRPN